MTSDAILIVHAIFRYSWMFFTSWNFPGTNVTPAEWICFSLLVVLVIRYVRLYWLGGDDDG